MYSFQQATDRYKGKILKLFLSQKSRKKRKLIETLKNLLIINWLETEIKYVYITINVNGLNLLDCWFFKKIHLHTITRDALKA